MAALLAGPVLAAACSDDEADRSPAELVVAEVNGIEITGDRFMNEYHRFKRRAQMEDSADKELEQDLRESILDTMIRQELLAQQAKDAKIEIPAETEEEEVQAMLKGSSPARLQTALQQQGQSYEEWRQYVRQNLIIDRLLKQKVAPMVEVTEPSIKEYYEAHLDEFKLDAQAHVWHILCDSLQDAERARLDLISGKSFAETAKAFSKSPEGATGGDLGTITRGQMPKELDDAIFLLANGQISRVIQSPYGYHVVKVGETAKPRQMSFSEAHNGIQKRLFQEQLERKFDEWLNEIRKNAKITLYPERLRRL